MPFGIGPRSYLRPILLQTMSDHSHEGHFPEEAEQNEIVLLIWAGC
jgi:hypothetical protein